MFFQIGILICEPLKILHHPFLSFKDKDVLAMAEILHRVHPNVINLGILKMWEKEGKGFFWL